MGKIKNNTHGGSRPGSGRKKLTVEEVLEREAQKRKILIDELLFPALSCAFHCDPGPWGDKYLEFELSKVDIKDAYGSEGLSEWLSFFSIKKIGGKNRHGHGYKTHWVLNMNKYGVVMKFLEELGHTVKDIPKVFFPPEAMLERLRLIHERREKKRLKHLGER